ncbi:Terminase small subunit [compost metagenome]
MATKPSDKAKRPATPKTKGAPAKRALKSAPKKPQNIPEKVPPATKARKGATPGGPSKPEDMNDAHWRFVLAYVATLNATQAYLSAYQGCAYGTARANSAKLLSNPSILAAIKSEQDDLGRRTKIDADRVIQRWWEIASADPNSLIQYRRVCCRHCHGIDHAYQWANEAEFERATVHAINLAAECKAKDIDAPALPTDEGGYGYLPSADPNADCPVCFGEGHGEPHVEDTRRLAGPARALYAGIKVTKDGIEVKMQDQGKALENIARHLGMFNDKLTLKGDPENPLRVLHQQISGTAFRPREDGEE